MKNDPSVLPSAETPSPFARHQAAWIWPAKPGDLDRQPVNQYVCFRRAFTCAQTAPAILHLAADSDYAVWLNGHFIHCGQFGAFPQDKTFDSLDLADRLQTGLNVLCILVQYLGETNFSYLCGEPGLIYVLQAGPQILVSNEQTVCRLSPAYRQGPIYRTTFQLGFSHAYDAAADDGWLQPGYDAGNWQSPCRMLDPVQYYNLNLRPRPLPKLVIGEPAAARLIAQGTLIRPVRPSEAQPDPTPAELMQSDYLSALSRKALFTAETWPQPDADADLPPDPAAWPGGLAVRPEILQAVQGIYLVFDLGREEAGYLDLDLEADAGTTIDIAHGEHLDDLRVRAAVGGRHFASRYRCSDGRQRFTHYFRRIGCRYLELHILPAGRRLVVHRASLLPAEYPLEDRGSFRCSDSLHNQIYAISRRTLQLCMHEHYEDCPWREQALYGMDSRNQALCGYYCFGEYQFPAVSFALLGDSLQPDGLLELIAPSAFDRTIPSFSLAWIIEVWEHHLYSGRTDLLRQQMPVVGRILRTLAGQMREGLLPALTGNRNWNFYEWAKDLYGMDDADLHEHPETVRFDAPLNLFFLLALQAGIRMADALSLDDLRDELSTCAGSVSRRFHPAFWSEDQACYRTYWQPDRPDHPAAGHIAELTQALALCAGVCPPPLADGLRRLIADGRPDLVRVTLSHSIYKYDALLADPDRYGKPVFESIGRDWGAMLYHGATSFWETIKGSCDFDQAGSLCHGWSAIPAYFYQAYILGIKPLEPGFRTFAARPLTQVFPQFTGQVPTPAGPITVSWDAADGAVEPKITAPAALRRIMPG